MDIVYITNESFLYHCYSIIKGLKKQCDIHVIIQAKEKTNEIDTWCKTFNAEFVKRRRFRNPFSVFSRSNS